MKQTFIQRILASYLLILSIFVFTQSVSAQEFNAYSEADIFIESSPRIPGPNESVTLNLKSYSFNLNNYYIAWFENGVKKSADFGNKEFNFTTGSTGEAIDITAVIEVGNQTFRKELRFSPSEVDLLWEAIDAYTPPFYKGKALPLTQAKIKVTAIPETQIIKATDAPNLVYYWENNYKSINNASGFGKQSYTFSANPLNTVEKISLTANDRQENSFAKNTISIPVENFDAKILFYEINRNGRIMTHRALNRFNVVDDETIQLSFHPLNMSSKAANFTDLYVDWKINNESSAPQDFSKQNEIYISSGGGSGSAQIGVSLEGINNILQQKTEFIDLIFTQ